MIVRKAGRRAASAGMILLVLLSSGLGVAPRLNRPVLAAGPEAPTVMNKVATTALGPVRISLAGDWACAGETLPIAVETERAEVDVFIDGTWGATQALQLEGSLGPRPITVVVTTGGERPVTVVEQIVVQVVDCPERLVSPVIRVEPAPGGEHRARLYVANAAWYGPAIFTWEFGDGTIHRSTGPMVEHDFAPAIGRDRPFAAFRVAVAVETAAGRVASGRTISLANGYAAARRRGLIQPPVTPPLATLRTDGDRLVGRYTIRNLEDEPLTFTDLRLEYIPCGPEHDLTRAPAAGIAAPTLRIEARSEADERLSITPEDLPAGVCGVAVHRSGQAAGGAAAVAAAYLTLPENPELARTVDDPAALALLNEVAEHHLPDQSVIDDDDLRQLVRAGTITDPADLLRGDLALGTPATLLISAAAEPLGQPCRPGEVPPRPGLSCQATGEWTVEPPRLLNALKGDVVLSASCGLIRDLLGEVGQQYSHSGIMVSNFDRIRHSTAAEARIADAAGTNGFPEAVLRYGWPGTITQTIDEAFNGQRMVNPGSREYLVKVGSELVVKGFNLESCPRGGMIPARVARPSPAREAALRPALRAAAEAALGIRGHYRFFGYSRAAIADDPRYDAPADAGWAAGTAATVCSSFVWQSFRRAGIDPDGPIPTADGLVSYSETDRRRAGQWLYDRLYEEAYKKAGWFGRLLTDAPDELANQVTNCLASDDCRRSAKDSSAWKNPGPGLAVSPDDILRWPIWEGYSEPLIYQAKRYARKYHWTASPASRPVGRIAGRVFVDNQPAALVRVALKGPADGPTTVTGANGRFQFQRVPVGRYAVEAVTLIGGIVYRDEQIVEVLAGEFGRVNLWLRPPAAESLRLVNVGGNLHIRDTETFGNPDKRDFPVNLTIGVTPQRPLRSVDFKLDERWPCADEVRVESTFTVTLLEDNAVQVDIKLTLFEGASGSCGGDDRDGQATSSVRVPPGATVEVPAIKVKNNEPGGRDWGELKVTIRNDHQP